MMLIVTPEDLEKLSPTCRRELISLLGSRGAQAHGDEMPAYFGDVEEPASSGFDQQSGGPTVDSIDDVLDEKRVVDLTVDQARELVGNISDESKKVLSRFAVGTPVAIEELIGDGKGQYHDFNRLKRSFVGAVNRRLRTVLRNRLAVLFSSDRDRKRIKITPVAAASLRQVLTVPEPTPEFEFFDKESGQCVSADSSSAKQLKERLQIAWQGFSGRPDPGCASIANIKILEHFLEKRFLVSLGEPTGYDEDSGKMELTVFSTKEDPAQLLSRMDNRGLVEFRLDDSGGEAYPCLSHTEVPGIVAALR